jgi:hypothetical protein
MIQRLKASFGGIITGVFLFGLVSVPLAAAATGSSNGMKVAPVRTDLVMKPGETKTVSVQLQNVTNADGEYQIITNDFDSKDESGAPALLLNGATNARHGLKNYMSTPKTVSVKKGEQKSITVSITLPKNIAGGGYYGAVRFAPASSDAQGANVSLSGSVASLILVSVPGDVKEDLQIASFQVRHGDSSRVLFTSNKDLKASVRFRNAGNVQEQPFGKIQLKKGDKVLGSFEVNASDPRGNVLPDSIRRFDVSLKNVGSFGKYTIQGNFGYGSNGQLLSASTTFYVVPLALIIVAVVLIALIVLAAIGGPRLLKRYNQRVLRSAGRR